MRQRRTFGCASSWRLLDMTTIQPFGWARALSITSVLVLAFLAFSVSAKEANASSRDCVRQCRDSGKLCGASIKSAFKGCKTDCRYVEDRDEKRACKLSCKDNFKAAKDSCKSDIQSCGTECTLEPPAPPPPPAGGGDDDALLCEESCREDFRTCITDGLGLAKQCPRDCTVAYRDAIKACRTQPSRFLCYIEETAGLAQCLHGCATSIRELPATCKADRESCIAACNDDGGGPTNPYGSASQAFTQPTASLLD